jgi:gliding motility-associated-like protein
MSLKTRIKFSFILSFTFLISNGYSQLTFNTALTPAQLVQNILVQGGLSISNITFTGNTGGATSQIGSFTNASATYLGLTSGVVLTTGYVPHIAAQGNATGNMSDQVNTPGDADLASLAGIALNKSFDPAILEFDFVPTGNTMSFTYVFGSEEEPNWVCSQYDDVFGFFLSGPGIAGPYTNGAINIALIPGTTYPVSVNTVNNGSIGSNTSGNNCPAYGLNYSAYYINNLPDPNIVFGGMTVVLTATATVTPCKTYHIKIAICDTGNGKFDSGVFLGANSFTSPNAVSVSPSYSNSTFGNNAIKGCSNGIISFTLPSAAAANDTVHYIIGGTAVNGVDYTTIPNNAIIPAGQDSVAVLIQPLQNGSTGTVIIGAISTCDTIYDTIHIVPYVPMNPNIVGANICSGSSATLNVTNSGGINPYTYNWSAGGTNTSINISPTTTTTYTVTATDKCNQTATSNAVVNVAPIPSLTIVPANPTVCPGNSTQLQVSGATTYAWSPPTGLSSTTDSLVTVTPAATQMYTVTGTSSSGCTNTATVTVTVANSITLTVTPINPIICPNGSVVLNVNGAANYTWSPAAGLSATTGASVTANPATTTTYTVLGTSGTCTGVGSVIITVSPSPVVTVTPNSPSICSGASVSLQASGASTYSWNPGTGISSTSGAAVIANPTATSTYTVLGTDANGCTGNTSVTVNVGPITVNATETDENCGHANGTVTAVGGGNCNQTFAYLWNSVPPQSNATATNLPAGVYTVTLSCGACTTSTSITVNNIAGPSVAITGSTNTTCGYANGSASASASGNNPPFNYNWSNSQAGATLANVTAGIYNVIVTDASGCSASNSITITDTPAPTATISSQNEVCNQLNGTATVNAIGGLGNYTYLWSDGQTSSTSIGLTQGSYSVTVSDSQCSVSTSVNVMEIPGPIAGFSEHPNILTVMEGPVTFTDNSTGNVVNWVWNFGDGTATGSGSSTSHPYPAVGTYLVTMIVTDNNGCKDTITDTVKVKDIFTFYIPSAFTPNGDDKNELFYPSGVNVDPNNFSMMIFDRWGNLVFNTNKWYPAVNHGEGWNGTLNNGGSKDKVVMDVYVYRIRVKEIDGPKHEYIGRITLVP